MVKPTFFDISTTPLVEPIFEHISEPTLEILISSPVVKQASNDVYFKKEEDAFTTPTTMESVYENILEPIPYKTQTTPTQSSCEKSTLESLTKKPSDGTCCRATLP